MKHTTLLLIYSCLLLCPCIQGYSQARMVTTDPNNTSSIETLPPPTIDVAISTDGGKAMRVRMFCEIADTEIYYTLDGTDPTRQSFLYTDEFGGSNKSMVIKAIATKNGYYDSPITEYTHGGSGIINEQTNKTIISRIYISPVGIVLRSPSEGMNIAITTYEDGQQEIHKVIWKP